MVVVVVGGPERVVAETSLDGPDLVGGPISVAGPDLADAVPILADAVPILVDAVPILVADGLASVVSDRSVVRRRLRLVDWPRWTRQGTSC